MAEESKTYWLGIVTGVIVGAAAALLMSPKPGAEVRDDLAAGAQNLKERGEDLIAGARAKSEHTLDNAAFDDDKSNGDSNAQTHDVIDSV